MNVIFNAAPVQISRKPMPEEGRRPRRQGRAASLILSD